MGHDGRESLVIEGIELSTKPLEFIQENHENTKE